MKKIAALLFISFLMISQIVRAQVGIGTINPDPSSILDLTSNSQGILVPRMTTAQRDAVLNPTTGLLMVGDLKRLIENSAYISMKLAVKLMLDSGASALIFKNANMLAFFWSSSKN